MLVEVKLLDTSICAVNYVQVDALRMATVVLVSGTPTLNALVLDRPTLVLHQWGGLAMLRVI